MSDFAVVKPKPIQMHAGAPIQAIVPTTPEEAWRLAQALYTADMVPASYDSKRGGEEGAKETVSRLMIGIMKSMEIGLAPMTGLASICVINNRPCLWGDAAVALVQKSGAMEWIKERLEGDPFTDAWTAVCEVKRVGQPEPYRRTFSYLEAQKANLKGKRGPWTEYPQRMLAMRARAWALRDAFADALMGLSIAEEVRDIPAPPAPAIANYLDDEPEPDRATPMLEIEAKTDQIRDANDAPAPRETSGAETSRAKETHVTANLAAKASEHNAPVDAANELARLEKAAAWLLGKIAAAPDNAAIDRLCASNKSDIDRIGDVLPDRKIEIMNAIAEKANEFYTPPYEAGQMEGDK